MGTTTLGICLSEFEFKHCSWNPAYFDLWIEGKIDELLKIADRYNSFDDFLWLLIYKELDINFPGSRFILTTRKDSETWFSSICKHATRTGPLEYRKVIYGYDLPHLQKGDFISRYESHNEGIRKYFEHREDDLLEICWESGDGWTEIARFLDLEPPDKPLPHANKSPTWQRS